MEQRNYIPLRIIFLRIFFSSASNATIQGSSGDVAVELIRGTYAGSASTAPISRYARRRASRFEIVRAVVRSFRRAELIDD